ncbi:MAG: DctP family TRAP transporter solute-binding subunit [Synergistaceae bacterium]|jgi:tripartite ATP-independent transporter DctP family solute receptor|nr:DctP family TRAP transporter solute-binding subunit [Synergistaceae bacterium]
MKKAVVLALAVVFLGLGAFPAGAAYKEEYKLDIVPSLSTGWGMGAQYFTDLVKERSGGKINIKVYANSQLTTGKQTNAFMLLRNGTIDFACQSTINYSPQIPELNLFALPFFMSGQPDRYRALDAITNGRAGELIAKAIEDKGGKFLCFGENGFREMTNSKKEIHVPEDLVGVKMRVVGSPLFLDTFRALGSNPVAMPWSDTIAALQQGTIDGQENPINTFYPLKVYEYNKYVTNWHYMGDPTMFVVNPGVWASFSSEDQELILKAAKDAAAYQIALARVGIDENDGGRSLEFLKGIGRVPEVVDWDAELKKVGMVVTNLTPEEIRKFVELTKPVVETWRKTIGEDLVRAAEADMAAVR